MDRKVHIELSTKSVDGPAYNMTAWNDTDHTAVDTAKDMRWPACNEEDKGMGIGKDSTLTCMVLDMKMDKVKDNRPVTDTEVGGLE